MNKFEIEFIFDENNSIGTYMERSEDMIGVRKEWEDKLSSNKFVSIEDDISLNTSLVKYFIVKNYDPSRA